MLVWVGLATAAVAAAAQRQQQAGRSEDSVRQVRPVSTGVMIVPLTPPGVSAIPLA